VINTPDFTADIIRVRVANVGGVRDGDDAVAADEDLVVPDTYPDPEPAVEKDESPEAESEATFLLTPRRRRMDASQVLVPETPIAEMGLTYVEKSAIARRRLREDRGKSDVAR